MVSSPVASVDFEFIESSVGIYVCCGRGAQDYFACLLNFTGGQDRKDMIFREWYRRGHTGVALT